MDIKHLKIYLIIFVFSTLAAPGFGQGSVPYGINYQAVARDNSGKELASKSVNVRFSVIMGDPTGGTVVYQELHQSVITSKYGVFSLVIGHGVPSANGQYRELSQIQWNQGFHYLKVEVKFDNDYIDMGTMQFLAVPYALYSQKSLEPGPAGPKGDPGDPASDDQTLSFNGNNLSISGGNTVNLSNLNIPHQLSLNGNSLTITGGNVVVLPDQIQDLNLDINNILKIDKNPAATAIDLTKFLDDKQQLSFNSVNNTLNITNGLTPVNLSKFDQTLSFNSSDNKLTISGGSAPVDLSSLKDDADANPLNEIQDIHLVGNQLSIDKNASSSGADLSKYDNSILSYNPDNFQLSVSHGSSVAIGNIIAFRAGITTSLNLPNATPVDLIFDQVTGTNYYNDGGYSPSSGVFQAPYTGIYNFSVSINMPLGNSSVIIKLTGTTYETIIGPTSSSGYFRASMTMKLAKNDIINIAIIQSNGAPINPYIISGTFSGYRVY
jgi:hypothetical protein